MSEQRDTTQSEENEKAPSKVKALFMSPWFKSAFLHFVIFASMVVSFNFSAKPLKFATQSMSMPNAQPEIVQATFIDSNIVAQKQREKAQAEAAAKQRQQEKLREERAERARKKRIADEQKKREEEKKAQEQRERDRLEQERIKEQQVAERLKKEAEEKVAQEQRQRELEKELADQLAQEQAQMSQANQRRIMSETEKYTALMYSKIKQNLNLDGGFVGKSCTVNVRLAPDGLVLQVRVLSGDSALCRLSESAVLKAGTLPMSKDPEVIAQMRNIDLIVRPERQ